MLEAVQEFYVNVFDRLEEYIKINSKLSPFVFMNEPKNKDLFPLVVVKNTNITGTDTTLSYGDTVYSFTLQINIFATSTEGLSGKTKCKELSDIIQKFFTNEMKMNLVINPDTVNLDEDVSRTIIYANCSLDTKYKDKIVILPY